ncbi:MAG: DegT/DnrJ/EryC1/StrS family aminotransferase [Candidatus Eremiobacteraeota bacterium]|nr:DegT/DnrJ/EryC1/StrS family aminotransferase [Candidatus Eremiobacteraeota bacterium]
MIPIAKPIIDSAEKKRVMEVLDSGMLSIGKVVKEFEEAFARFTGARYAVATSSGTTALHMALLASGIKPGDKVLTTPFSFVATANSILYCNAVPVFCDVEEGTCNIDPDRIEEALKNDEEIKALLIVHLYGQPCNMDRIMKLVQKYDLILVEDAAQAHGALYKGKHGGTFGNAGAFSFYPTKNMTTAEGGMIITDDEKVHQDLKLLREHGGAGDYDHIMLGYNYRMTNIEAAIGLVQLEKLTGFNNRRRENAAYYDSHLSNLDWLEILEKQTDCLHCYHQYTIRVKKDRDRFVEYLKENGIGCKVYYPHTIPSLPLYKEKGYNGLPFPVSGKLCDEVVSIPVHPSVSDEDREKIVKVIKDW